MAAVVGRAEPVSAADISTPPPPVEAPPPPAEFDWTGFYIGAHLGFGLDHFGFKYAINAPTTGFSGTGGITSNGPIAGVQTGFNYEIPIGFLPGGIVLGLEGTDSWSGIRGVTTVTDNSPVGNAVFGTRFLNFGTISIRAGYALGPFLLYVTRGLTYGVVESTYQVSTATGFSSAGSKTVARSGTPLHVGAVGFGAEYALTPNWTIRAEYLYEGLIANYQVFQPAAHTVIGFGTRTMYHIGRVGLTYKFDWPWSRAPALSSFF